MGTAAFKSFGYAGNTSNTRTLMDFVAEREAQAARKREEEEQEKKRKKKLNENYWQVFWGKG